MSTDNEFDEMFRDISDLAKESEMNICSCGKQNSAGICEHSECYIEVPADIYRAAKGNLSVMVRLLSRELNHQSFMYEKAKDARDRAEREWNITLNLLCEMHAEWHTDMGSYCGICSEPTHHFSVHQEWCIVRKLGHFFEERGYIKPPSSAAVGGQTGTPRKADERQVPNA